MEAAAASLLNATIFSIPGIGHFVAPWLPQHARRSASALCFRALRLVDVGDDGHGSDVEQPERRNNEPPGIPMSVDIRARCADESSGRVLIIDAAQCGARMSGATCRGTADDSPRS